MARDKFDPRIERDRQYNAFLIYRDLGFRRSFSEVARQINASPHSVSNWAKWYKWKERLDDHVKAVEKKKEEGALVKVDDPVVEKMMLLMQQKQEISYQMH